MPKEQTRSEILPSFREGERIVIGYLLVYPASAYEISRLLPISAFTDSVCKASFDVIINQPGDTLSVLLYDIAVKSGDPDVITKLEDYVRDVVSDINIYDIVDRLNNTQKRRSGILIARKAERDFQDSGLLVERVVAEIVSKLTDPEFKSDSLIEPKQFSDRRTKGLDRRKVKGFVPTGFTGLDKYLTEGFAAGCTSVIAGRPNMGKSALKQNIIIRLCDQGLSVLSLVPEAGFDREQDRIDSIRTGRELRQFYRAREWDDSFMRDIKASGEYISKNWAYVVQEDPFISFAEMERNIIYTISRQRLDIVFIDLFDRLEEVSNARPGEKHEVIKRLLQRQAALAKKHDIHFCNLVQIRRSEGVKDKIRKYKPTLEQLKDSGAYEEITDLVFLLFREGYYDEAVPDDIVEVIIAKQRQGVRNKKVVLDADWERVTLDDLPEGYGD